MALTATSRGTNVDTVSGSSFSFSPTSNLTAGALAVLFLSADNSSSGGSTNNTNSVTDTLGNTWRKVVSSVCDPGVANAGVQGSAFVTDQSAGQITTSTTITVTFGAATVAKAWAIQDVTAAAGKQAVPLASGNNTQQTASTTPTVTTGTISVDDLVFGMAAIEGGGAVTADSDTTNGTWSSLANPWTGTATGGICLGVQSKVQDTTASTQTYNPTLGAARDLICSWLSIREIAPKNLALAGVG